jgi:hypothetical protein
MSYYDSVKQKKKFRPIQESIDIVEKMLAIAAYFPTEYTTDAKTGQKITVIEYWEKRLHGYLKLASLNGVKVRSILRDEADKQ